MSEKQAKLPPLEQRFLPPEGWRWHHFKTPRGRTLRFGTVSPKDTVPDAVVVILTGLSEFSEKYYETARDLLGRNLSVWIMDWQGQGLSERFIPKNPQKRHSRGFDEDVADLHCFIKEYVKHAAVHPDVGRIPLVMLGHSMGANIGMRYLAHHPDMFACAAFSAPMVGIKKLNMIPPFLRLPLTALFQEVAGQNYVFGGGEWTPQSRANPGNNIFSSDPTRDRIHNAWCEFDPRLQVGNVTFGWLHEANKSCHILQRAETARSLNTPCLFALAGKDDLVNNDIARRVIKMIPHAKVLELRDAKHEILMESDKYRNEFLQEFDNLLRVNNIRHKLEKF